MTSPFRRKHDGSHHNRQLARRSGRSETKQQAPGKGNIMQLKHEIAQDIDELMNLLKPSWPLFDTGRLVCEETPEEKAAREAREADADKDDDDDDEDNKEPDGKKSDKKEKDDEDEYVRLPKGEAERLRRENSEAKKRERKREREEKEKAEKDKAEKGKWEEIASDRAKERDEAIKERDEAKQELIGYKRQQRVSSKASKLLFIDPADAHLYLKDEEMDDDDRTERALKRVLREKPHLKSTKRSSGVPLNGNEGGLTFEQIQNMTEEEIIARKPEVDKALAAMSKSGG